MPIVAPEDHYGLEVRGKNVLTSREHFGGWVWSWLPATSTGCAEGIPWYCYGIDWMGYETFC
jgi:hypothetical protein